MKAWATTPINNVRNAAQIAFYEKLYHENFGKIWKYIRHKIDSRLYGSGISEDIAQDTFLEALKNLETLAVHSNPGGWLMDTANKKCQNYLRGAWKRRALHGFSIDEENAPEIEDRRAAQEITARMEEYDVDVVMNQIRSELPLNDYLLYTQVYEQKIPQKELARYYGISGPALRMRVVRVRRAILGVLKNILALVVTFANSIHI